MFMTAAAPLCLHACHLRSHTCAQVSTDYHFSRLQLWLQLPSLIYIAIALRGKCLLHCIAYQPSIPPQDKLGNPEALNDELGSVFMERRRQAC
mmetsp:Transcript_2108/g.5367  ORF Transcript_2108/g.5367 Transcript_2108/m.5367 type:complete len:93 (+) Transcript_2108:984-1262(+)